MTKRALLLPGRAYPVTMPLLASTRVALEEHGWEVRPVGWTAPDPVPTDGVWVGSQAATAIGDGTGPWLFAAKSLGTRVAQSSLRADAYVLLTPLLSDPAATAAITGLVGEGRPVLLAGGTADPYWSSSAARSTGAEVLEVPGADHAMDGCHLEVAATVSSFVASLRL